jgi:uncharacterized Zn finger protein (UPF0148 family)
MTLEAFCSNCGRTLYIEEGETPICPVCSSPLIQPVDTSEDGAQGEAKATPAHVEVDEDGEPPPAED